MTQKHRKNATDALGELLALEHNEIIATAIALMLHEQGWTESIFSEYRRRRGDFRDIPQPSVVRVQNALRDIEHGTLYKSVTFAHLFSLVKRAEQQIQSYK